MATNHRLQRVLNSLLIVVFLTSFVLTAPVQASVPTRPQPQTGVTPGGEGPRLGYDAETGRLNFVGGSREVPLGKSRVGASAGEARATAEGVLAQYGSGFGLTDPARELTLDRVDEDGQGSTLRYQQAYQGIPVLGGEMLVNRGTDGSILSLSGEVSPHLVLKTTQAAVSAEAALAAAQAGMKEWYGLEAAQLQPAEPALWIYDPRLLGPGEGTPQLVWRVELRTVELQPVNELVLVDAASGRVVLHFNQIDSARPDGTKQPQPHLLSPVTWYVSTLGDDLNSCRSPEAPCEKISTVFKYVATGDTIKAAAGIYRGEGSLLIRNGITFLGGWNEDFTAQIGYTTLAGEKSAGGLYISCYDSCVGPVTLSNIAVTNIEQDDYTASFDIHYNGVVKITNSIIYGNRSGGMEVGYRTNLRLSNTTISNNTRTKWGAAGLLVYEYAIAYLNNVTIVNNVSNPTQVGSGLIISHRANVSLSNTIIANNTATDYPNIYIYNPDPGYLKIISEGHNLFGDVPSNSGLQVLDTDQIGKDIRVSDFHPGGYHTPLNSSPARDRGNPLDAGTTASACEPMDQAGNPRPADGDLDGTAICDIGAYEAQPLAAGEGLIAWSKTDLTAPANTDMDEPFSVLVLDANGQPWPGAQVAFTVMEGAGGTFEDTGTGQTLAVADERGIATSSLLTSADITGQTVIEATIPESTAAALPFRVNVYTPVPTYLKPVAGTNQAADTGAEYSTSLQAQVYDQNNRRMSGAEITFTAPSSGASGMFAGGGLSANVVSDPNGIATAPVFTANGQRGAYRVIASAETVKRPASFKLINQDNLYIRPNGWDTTPRTSNDCRNPGDPCKTFEYAWNLARPGTTLYFAAGSYPFAKPDSDFSINKGTVTFSGGWNNDFTARVGATVLDKFQLHVEETAGLNLTGILFTNSSHHSISNNGTLDFQNGVMLFMKEYGLKNYGEARLTNVSIGEGQAGGILNAGNLTLMNVTVAYNLGDSLSNSGNLTLQNSILANNNGRNCVSTSGSVISAGYNLTDEARICSGNSVTPATTDQTGAAIHLSTLTSQEYYPLQAGSPAIDIIDPAEPEAFCPASDQRGLPRPSGEKCDSGANEYVQAGEPVRIVVHSGASQKAGQAGVLMTPVIAQVQDAAGQPVPWVSVRFQAPNTGPSAIFADTNANQAVILSDAKGFAAPKSITNNNEVGSYKIFASVEGVAQPAEFQVEVRPALYVDFAKGDDYSNNCQTATFPCRSLKTASAKALAGDTIELPAGILETDSPLGEISKSITISGGWNSDFTERIGHTISKQVSPSWTYPRTSLIVPAGVNVYIKNLEISGEYVGLINSGNVIYSEGAFYKNKKAILNMKGGSITLRNVTMRENGCFDADCYEGEKDLKPELTAIENQGTVELDHVTISGNYRLLRASERPPQPALPMGGGTIRLRDTIITENYNNEGYWCSGTITSLGHNVITGTDYCSLQAVEGDLFGSDYEPVYSRLEYAGDNGGGTITFALQEGSPAIDAGDPDNCPLIDQRGVARPQGSGCDIGAYEGSVSGEFHPILLTYTANGAESYPWDFICRSWQEPCTDVSLNEADAVDAAAAHHFGREVYLFFLTHFNRNGGNGHGYPVVSTIHYGINYRNAFWSGSQIVYGQGFPMADDIVAHEFTHGVTSVTARLLNYYESGAIGESLSDLFGEYFDQTNGEGSDGPIDAWLIGEDTPGGAFRSMSNPTRFKHPDKMTSSYYQKTVYDNGGVHTNSGVGNKAAYLVVNGGRFNSISVAPLGWEKTTAIYYYAQNHLLTSGANYPDLYQALYQSCIVLSDGELGISLADCQQVRNATDAVVMNKSVRPEAPACPAGYTQTPTTLFFDDFENGDANWQYGAEEGNPHFSVVPGDTWLFYAASGEYALFGDDYDDRVGPGSQTSDSHVAMRTPVTVPPDVRTFLHFKHSFGFEFGIYLGKTYFFHGGFLEYSIDDGATWKDANPLFSAGQGYRGKIYGGGYSGHNPLQSRPGFVGESRGYVSSSYELTKLVGQNVRFRWRMSTDYTGARVGWAIDDVSIYSCVRDPKVPVLSQPAKESLSPTYTPTLTWLPAEFAARYELQVATTPDFSDPLVSRGDLIGTQYTFGEDLPANTRFYWRVRAFSSIDVASAWSQVRTFRTRLVTPQPELPTSHAVDSLRPTFIWSETPGAASYRLVVSLRPDLAYPKLSVNVTGARYTPAVDLPAGKLLYWRVMANGANPSAWSSVFDLTTPLAPSIPKAASPGLNALVSSTVLELKWTASKTVSGAPALAAYHLEVDDSADFSSPLFTRYDLTTNTLSLPAVLPSGSKMYWRVRAVNEQGQYSSWSSSYFRTFIQPPDLIAPPEGTPVADTTPTFDWSDSTGATSYSVLITPGPSMSSPLVSTSVTISTYTPVKPLPAGKVLYWRVRANGPNGLSAWSGPWQFQVQ